MNLRLSLLLPVLVGASWLRAADAGVDAATAEATSFRQIRVKIEALFRGRDAAPVLPPDVVNPFSRPEERALSANSRAGGSGPRPTLSDRGLLERIAPAIQVRGIVEAGGHPSIIINRKLFDEGDSLTVLYGEITVEIVIKRITEDTFTLGYKDAELTLRLPR
jgi:hypothetical protein